MPKTKPASRTQRWSDAAAAAREAVDNARDLETQLNDAKQFASDALEMLRDVQSEYQEWYDNMPEGLQSSPTGEKLSAVCDIDLNPDEDDLDAIDDAVGEAEGAELPMGWGRDN